MPIHILAVGKKHDAWVQNGISRYESRLRKPFSVEWMLLPHSHKDGDMARQDESQRILARIRPEDYIIVLDERGILLDSPALANALKQATASARTIFIIIGGAYGVTDQLRHRANLVWSLSPLVFPHQLVRLIVTEQLYRCQEISAGRPYHHE